MIIYPTTIAELEQAGLGPIIFDTFGAEIQAKLLEKGWIKYGPAPTPTRLLLPEDRRAYDRERARKRGE